MVIHYDNDSLSEIFETQEFLEGYEVHKRNDKTVSEFKDFIDKIEINKKYFRLDMNKTGYRKKYHKQNVSEDTRAIKEIKHRLADRDYLYMMIVESFIEKCIIYPQYNQLYLTGLMDIYGSKPDFKQMLVKCMDDAYDKIIHQDIKEESEYLMFCAKNKRLDKLIGHSMLLTECEKTKIVKGRIHPSIESLMGILRDGSSDEESYKCVQCLYEILKSLYGDSLLPQGYIDQIQGLIKGEKKPKIKYKMMDILERR